MMTSWLYPRGLTIQLNISKNGKEITQMRAVEEQKNIHISSTNWNCLHWAVCQNTPAATKHSLLLLWLRSLRQFLNGKLERSSHVRRSNNITIALKVNCKTGHTGKMWPVTSQRLVTTCCGLDATLLSLKKSRIHYRLYNAFTTIISGKTPGDSDSIMARCLKKHNKLMRERTGNCLMYTCACSRNCSEYVE